MSDYNLVETAEAVIPITLCTPSSLPSLIQDRPHYTQRWIEQHQFKAAPSSALTIPAENGDIAEVLWGLDESSWQLAALAGKLPAGNYQINDWQSIKIDMGCVAWALASYRFDRYKEQENLPQAKLLPPPQSNIRWITAAIQSITLVRDLINTPACDLTPETLAEVARTTTQEFKATFSVVCGDQLQKDYPSIYTVGKAAECSPRLIDIKWVHPKAKKTIAIVGKGVCFDSGGLDIKPSSGMLTMKKDMGGAAHALALSYMIMKLNLPLSVRLLIPAVENAISSNAMHPLDIIKTRKGLTVEIGNTDAEGRLILADALHEASQDKPDLLINFATLTGAARVALGTELPALFSNNLKISADLIAAGLNMDDPLWPMPLHKPYAKFLKSPIADLSSTGKSSYGGAITAALFLENFVSPDINWVHIDQMAWNLSSQPGRPEGGEAMGLLAAFNYIAQMVSVSWH